MESVGLKYIDSSLTIHEMDFEVLSVSGFDNPDNVQLFPPIINTSINGYKKTQFIGFRRVIGLHFGLIDSYSGRRFLLNWMKFNNRSILYIGSEVGAEELFTSFEFFQFENEYLINSSIFKNFKLQVVENVVRNTWSNYTPPSIIDIMYIKTKVKVIGTASSPEVFTTNFGKLVTDETGQPYPAISLLSYVATVIVNGSPYQDAKINLVGNVSNSGTDLTFQLAISTAGADSGDGFCYADIVIGLQERP